MPNLMATTECSKRRTLRSNEIYPIRTRRERGKATSLCKRKMWCVLSSGPVVLTLQWLLKVGVDSTKIGLSWKLLNPKRRWNIRKNAVMSVHIQRPSWLDVDIGKTSTRMSTWKEPPPRVNRKSCGRRLVVSEGHNSETSPSRTDTEPSSFWSCHEWGQSLNLKILHACATWVIDISGKLWRQYTPAKSVMRARMPRGTWDRESPSTWGQRSAPWSHFTLQLPSDVMVRVSVRHQNRVTLSLRGCRVRWKQ